MIKILIILIVVGWFMDKTTHAPAGEDRRFRGIKNWGEGDDVSDRD